jgi:hypothetical protein
VLAYLSRYTHRMAISNRRLIAIEMPSPSLSVECMPMMSSGAAAG